MTEVFLENIWKYMQEFKAEPEDNTFKKCCDLTSISDIDGYGVCVNCGIVVDRHLLCDDPYSFENGNNNIYVHSAPSSLYPKSSLGTTINGNSKLARTHNWSKMPYSERVIWEVSTDLNSKLTNHLSQRIINDSLYLYKKLYEKLDSKRGKNKKGIVAACVYFACIENHANINVSRLSQLMDIDTSTLNKSIKILSPLVNQNTCVKSSDLINPICDKLGIAYNIRRKVSKICSQLDKETITDGILPQNICASTIFFVCQEINQAVSISQLSSETGVSQSSIKKINALITKHKQYIFSKLV
jgi:transcription initiation factor TFIIIB Brf1 subunit/transcription initiation factor TFIIB